MCGTDCKYRLLVNKVAKTVMLNILVLSESFPAIGNKPIVANMVTMANVIKV